MKGEGEKGALIGYFIIYHPVAPGHVGPGRGSAAPGDGEEQFSSGVLKG